MELMWMKLLAPNATEARTLARTLEGYLASAKIRSPRYPGWYVGWTVLRTSECGVLVVFHVEPEADLPQV